MSRTTRETPREESFRRLYERTPAILHSIDSRWRIVGVSDRWLEVMGYEREEVLGRKSIEFLTEESRDYATRVVLPEFFRVGHCEDVPYTYVKKSGATFEALLSGILERDERGNPLRSYAVITDVSARRSAERSHAEAREQLRFALAAARMGTWNWDPRTNHLIWSPEVAPVFGIATGEAPRTLEGFLALIHPGDRDRVAQRTRAFLEGGLETFSVEYRVVLPDGRTRWIESRGQTYADRAGKPARVTGTVADVTDRRLAARNAELEAFAASVSHDLRSPLRIVNGLVRSLADDQSERLDELGREYVARVLATTTRMGRLIDDLLRLSHVNVAELERRPVDLSALAESVAAELRAADPGRKVTVTIEPGLVVSGDAELLRCALTNLIGNAWKFTARRQEAHVAVGKIVADGQDVYFVRDDGAGFDSTAAAKLFQPFQRFHQRGEFEGTGLGLAIVQRVIERHGGRVWAESSPGAGATFSFTLP